MKIYGLLNLKKKVGMSPEFSFSQIQYTIVYGRGR